MTRSFTSGDGNLAVSFKSAINMKYQYFPIYLLMAVLATSYGLGHTPLLISFVFLMASILAYISYAKDKAAARNGEWRVSENTLHLLSLLCGWPGAIIAQQRLRHKTKKISFRIMFWLSLSINIAGVIWIHLPEGSKVLRSSIYSLEYFIVNEFGSNSVVSVILYLTKFNAVI